MIRPTLIRYALITGLLVLAGGVGRADDNFAVDTAKSSLTYHIVHKLHRVDGTSKKVEGRARLLSDGKAQIAVRAPVESFDSGNVNRDEHMKETVGAASFPMVDLKAVSDSLRPPSSFPGNQVVVCKAQVTMHGVMQPVDVEVHLAWQSPTQVRATAKLNLSVDGFKVERPSLMFVKIDDKLVVDADLVFVRQ